MAGQSPAGLTEFRKKHFKGKNTIFNEHPVFLFSQYFCIGFINTLYSYFCNGLNHWTYFIVFSFIFFHSLWSPNLVSAREEFVEEAGKYAPGMRTNLDIQIWNVEGNETLPYFLFRPCPFVRLSVETIVRLYVSLSALHVLEQTK